MSRASEWPSAEAAVGGVPGMPFSTRDPSAAPGPRGDGDCVSGFFSSPLWIRGKAPPGVKFCEVMWENALDFSRRRWSLGRCRDCRAPRMGRWLSQ